MSGCRLGAVVLGQEWNILHWNIDCPAELYIKHSPTYDFYLATFGKFTVAAFVRKGICLRETSDHYDFPWL